MKILDLLARGPISYLEGDRLQRQTYEQVGSGRADHTLIVAQFEPTYTAGRSTKDSDILNADLPVIRVDRGGSVTWHGPGQLVVYPVVKLAEPVDVIKYIRAVERAVVRTGQEAYGLDVTTVEGRAGAWILGASSEAASQHLASPDPNPEGQPGVSPQGEPGVSHQTSPSPNQTKLRANRAGVDKKICAIGLKVAAGTTLHGVAFNIHPDFSSAFTGIIPCGLTDAGVTSLFEQGVQTTAQDLAAHLTARLSEELAPLLAPWPRPAGEGKVSQVTIKAPQLVLYSQKPAANTAHSRVGSATSSGPDREAQKTRSSEPTTPGASATVTDQASGGLEK